MPYFKYQSKNIFFSEAGKGNPVVFLHGNTASSKMFEPLLPLYQEHFRVILIDFLGNGQSERVEKFPVAIWFEEALQTIALIEHLGYEKVNLVGVSGGAWAGLSAALERPDLIKKVVADSFDGRTLHDNFAEELLKGRAAAKADVQARQFYTWCHGEDWEKVIDCDTEAVLQCVEQKMPLFHKSLKTLQVPVLLMGSKEDTMVRKNLLEEYQQILEQVCSAKIHVFEKGFHPSIASNAEKAAQMIQRFLEE